MRKVFSQAKSELSPDTLMLCGTKGLEEGTLKTMGSDKSSMASEYGVSRFGEPPYCSFGSDRTRECQNRLTPPVCTGPLLLSTH